MLLLEQMSAEGKTNHPPRHVVRTITHFQKTLAGYHTKWYKKLLQERW